MGRHTACDETEEMETYLQIRARMSPLPVANRLPVGLGATEMTVRR